MKRIIKDTPPVLPGSVPAAPDSSTSVTDSEPGIGTSISPAPDGPGQGTAVRGGDSQLGVDISSAPDGPGPGTAVRSADPELNVSVSPAPDSSSSHQDRTPQLDVNIGSAPDGPGQGTAVRGSDPELSVQVSPAPDTDTNRSEVSPELGVQIQAAPDGDGSVLGGSNLISIPMQGGAITVREKANLRMGQFSMVQNMRGQHPGFKQRSGQAKLHTTADGSNKCVDVFQFNKTKVSDNHFLALFSDGDILDATNDPPTVTTGVFGPEIWDGTSSPDPPSWSIIDDKLLFSNGVDQHQIYGGARSYVAKLVVYRGSGAPPTVPTVGEDFSVEVSDGQDSTVAVLDSLNTYANNEMVFIGTPVPINSLTWTVPAVNGNVSTAELYYKNTDNAWTDTSMTDGTRTGGNTTLGQTGAMTWTIPTDEQSSFMYGVSMFWYQLRVLAQLGATVRVSDVTFGAPFQNLRNIWDGVPVDAVEVQVEGSTQYSRYAAGSVDLGSLTSGKKIVIGSSDPLEGIYIDCGSTPNATGTAITSLKYWDGNSFASVGAISSANDGTSGMSSPGWITFPRKTAYKHQFGTSTNYAYWYELIWNTTISSDVVVYIQTMPYFDIGDFGKIGKCSAIWNNRGVYSFDRNPEYMYISAAPSRGASPTPMVLNGFDFRIKETGDGRPNVIVAMKNFYTELMVFQEESGVDGGTVSLLYGDSTSAKQLVISYRLGTFSAKTVDVVDGIQVTAETNETPRTLAFFLSRLGMCVCDGQKVTIISDDIQNYFDPEKTECIRRGYEKEHWLKYDSTDIVIRMGIVSGTSATVPNIFPVYDLIDGSFYFDTPAQELSCMTEVEAQSGNVNRIQVGGGVDDGFVYRVNTGTNDVSTAIDGYVQPEFDVGGLQFDLAELILRMKTQSSGNVTITPYINDQSQTTISLAMTVVTSGDATRRHRLFTSQIGDHVSLKLQNSTASQELYLENLRVKLDSLYER